MTVNYYEILEIPSDADEREIKKAYHRLARELHPDKASSPEEARKVEERFAAVSAAYNALKDPEKRSELNRNMAKGAQGPSAGGGPIPTATARVMNVSRGRANAAEGASESAQAGGGAKPAVGITPERVAIAQKAFARGMQFFKENNLPKAISFFEAAIQNNDQEAFYHARLAMALIKERRSATRAIDAAQKAIDLDPYNLEHKFNLAFIYETIGSKSNATRIYKDILRWDADNPRAKTAVAALKHRRGAFGLGLGKSADGAGGILQRLLGRFKR